MKEKLRRIRSNLVRRRQSLPVHGLHHYQYRSAGERSRIHLRIDPDGHGLLLVNANRIMHLNPTAAVMAYCSLEGYAESEAIKALKQNYKVPTQLAKEDYAQFIEKLEELIRPTGACPIHDLDIDTVLPFSAKPSAPYRMDLALTYRCNNDCPHCYNARPRHFTEMSTSEWKSVIDSLWKLGIPHVVFTGGEPTLRTDLPELIAYAESKGQITGLNTNARRLSDPSYAHQLVESGLDHVQITIESHDPVIHDFMVDAKGAWTQTIAGLRVALDTPLYVMTNTTMLTNNSPHLRDTLDFLAKEGVPTIGLNALIYAGRGRNVDTGLREDELIDLLEIAQERTNHYRQRLIWYTPTQYCHFDPMQLELGVKGCTAALYNMCVEPDGGVIPCQSYYHQLGNILRDPWESIWNHDLSINLRQRANLPTKCTNCALLSECGGGCPLKFDIEQ
ncbi:MAG: radical SAM protein [Anaerolineales bacterium]